MPPQIIRLVLLTIAIVGTYILARFLLTPSSFGQYGNYRGAALGEMSSLPTTFAGKAECTAVCHADQGSKLSAGSHKSLSCEACHGPGGEHAENPDVKLNKEVMVNCIRCHEFNPSRPKWHKQVLVKDHYTGSKCIECHTPHSPMEDK
jgi:hypothetical protein